MSMYHTLSMAICAGFLMMTLGGCEQEGPGERAGEKVDKAAEEAGEAMEKAGDKVKDATN